MFEELHQQHAQRPADAQAHGEPFPDAVGAGRAQRSEPERSDGERSGARPAPTASPPSMASPPRQDDDSDESSVDAAGCQEHRDEPFAARLPRLSGRGKPGRRLVNHQDFRTAPVTAEQRLLLLDTWQRSGLPAGDFAALVGLSKHTLYAWKKKFDAEGPAGLMDQPRGAPRGSRLPDLTKRSILMLKQANPDWGCQKISDMLLRGPALPASASAVAQVLHEAGYVLEEVPTRPHPDKVRHFERARANQLWQTDLFTFILKRQNRRVYLVAFMDDHSRYITSYGLHASQSSALVLETLRAGLTSYGVPQEILTDNGSQYVTWRGKSVFTRELEKRGIKQVVARPRHPQTLGKIERFWGTLWRECIESAVFIDMGDAQRRIGLFIDHYNFQRPHQGIDGLVPADRYFGAASEVLKTLQARVSANALELARHGVPKEALYLTGQVGGKPVSLHAEGERVILTGPTGTRQEIDLTAARPSQTTVAGTPTSTPASLPEPLCPAAVIAAGLAVDVDQQPGTSPLDAGLRRLADAFGTDGFTVEIAEAELVDEEIAEAELVDEEIAEAELVDEEGADATALGAEGGEA
jgi:transposase InsO family protein